jgi:hypothetical protein
MHAFTLLPTCRHLIHLLEREKNIKEINKITIDQFAYKQQRKDR